MTPTERARRSDELYYDTESVARRCLCDMIANRESDLEDAQAENARLRESTKRLMTQRDGRLARAEAENAKLRELVRDLWRFTGAACKKYPRLFDPAAQGGQMVQPNAIDAFEQRMRDLGVEVD